MHVQDATPTGVDIRIPIRAGLGHVTAYFVAFFQILVREQIPGAAQNSCFAHFADTLSFGDAFRKPIGNLGGNVLDEGCIDSKVEAVRQHFKHIVVLEWPIPGYDKRL